MIASLRGWLVQRLTRAAPVLVSGAVHVLLGLGLYLLATRLVAPPQLLMADLVEHPTGGSEPERRSALPDVLHRRLSSPRPVTRGATRTETAVAPPSPSPSPAPATEPSPTTGAGEPISGASAPAVSAGQSGPAGRPEGDGAGVGAPTLGHRVAPSYPESMRRAALEGTAVVLAAIHADGSVGDVRLRQSAGHWELDTAAVDAVRRWRFRPAQRRGLAVEFCCIEIPIVFRLQ